MKLYLIYKKKTNRRTLKLFQDAGLRLGVEIVVVASNKFDFSSFEVVGAEDAVICLSDDPLSGLVEKSMIGRETKTLYKNYETAISKIDDADDVTSYLIHTSHDLPVIPSIPAITRDKKLLKKYVESLGGLPIVIKALGGSQGHGTMRIDTMESLNSIDDYLFETDDKFIMKKYIEEERSVRAVVLGNQVIASMKHEALQGDFRSNSGIGDHHASAYDITPEESAIAVAAVSTLNFEFGGVDLSIDAEGKTYITEVNMPCSFVTVNKITQKPIADLIIQHLMNK